LPIPPELLGEHLCTRLFVKRRRGHLRDGDLLRDLIRLVVFDVVKRFAHVRAGEQRTGAPGHGAQ
jgi:hypothetical protein